MTPEEIEQRKKEIENMTEGDVAFEAYWMKHKGYVTTEWAMHQIKRGIGDVASATFWMRYFGYVSTKWAKKQIERGIGNVAWAAYKMRDFCCQDVIYGYVSTEWAMKQIKRGIGDSWIIHWMEDDGYIDDKGEILK